MGTMDRHVDAYIEKSADFARPILTHLRDVVHSACPAVEETMEAFQAMPPSHRREYLEWIGSAKREDTRRRRIAKAVPWAGIKIWPIWSVSNDVNAYGHLSADESRSYGRIAVPSRLRTWVHR